jgi:uncharacterized cupin superfamily protein
MASGPNVFKPETDEHEDREGFRLSGVTLGPKVGAERLGASLYELPPGQRSVPYHWHAANEEMLIVLRGTVSVRDPNGWRDLHEGAVVAFPRGEHGAHQTRNDTEETVRFLVVSEMVRPDVVVYPDSGKVGARTGFPDDPKAVRLNWRAEDAVDYWDGET